MRNDINRRRGQKWISRGRWIGCHKIACYRRHDGFGQLHATIVKAITSGDKARLTKGIKGDFDIVYESTKISSSFDPPVQARIQREVERILTEAITWSDVVTYTASICVVVVGVAIVVLHMNLKRVDRAIQASTRRSRAELDAMVKESNSKTDRPPTAPTPPPLKKVTWAPMVKEISSTQSVHRLIPRPIWTDAKPKPQDQDFMV